MANSLLDFVSIPRNEVSLSGFFFSLLLAAFLSYLLSKVYTKYGTSLSNRQKFASNFVLLTLTTLLVISVVKSSLALSLGLVGALSIVRFRAAIKEPEELMFLFIALAIGLGLGAGQWEITVVAFIIITLLIVTRHGFRKKEQTQNLYLTISATKQGSLSLQNLVDILNKHCRALQLKRYDHSGENLEASFLVDLDSYRNLNSIKKEVYELSRDARVIYLDRDGII